MSDINKQLKDILDAVVGDESKQQLTEDLGTAMLQRANRDQRIGEQKKQRIAFKVCPADIADRERPADVTREDSRYIRSMCTSSRSSFPRL